MKKECSSVSRLLDKYFDQEATLEEKSFVDAHLLDCPLCQRSLESMQRLRGLIKSPVEQAIEKEDFPWVWEKIERGIQRQEKPSLWESLWPWVEETLLRKKILIPAMAAAAAFILITAPLLFKKSASLPTPSVVEYVQSETYNVMIYELENQKVTVIWLFDGSEEEFSRS